MLSSPCRYCADRRPLCHAECEKYKAFRVSFDRDHVERVRKQQAVDFLDRGTVRALQRYHWKRR